MPNSRSERTRQRILDAAEALILKHGLDGVGLEAVAEAAGVSRQAVYDKFGSKGGLLRAMVAGVEARSGTTQAVEALSSEPDGLSRLAAMVRQNRLSEPGGAPLRRVVYAARLHDPTAAELWEDRSNARHRAMGQVVAQLAREGRLRPGLSIARATDILWSLINPLHYESLVATRGWTLDEYNRHLDEMARAALLGEPPPAWQDPKG